MTAGPAELPAVRRRLAPRVTAGVLAGLVPLLTGTLVAEAVLNHEGADGRTGLALTLMLWVIAAVGLVVAWHQPRNVIGWLMLGAPVFLLLTLASQTYVRHAYRAGQHALPVLGPVALVFAQQFFVFFVAFPLIILLFPDGRLPSPRWRWALWLYLALSLTAQLAELGVTIDVIVSHAVHVLPDNQLAQVQNPAGGLAWTENVGALFLAGLAGWVTALCRQVLSWRRTSGERRQQLKWLMTGAAACGVFLIASVATGSSLWAVWMLGAAALPVSIGVGILKYRLYDIDRIISRTLAYALVTGLLIGVYAGLVLPATEVLGFGSTWAVAGSTLAAAALFTPLRRRVQRVVDRRFNRARYDADAAVEAFATRLAGAVALPEVRADLLAVAGGALEPAHLAVWIAEAER